MDRLAIAAVGLGQDDVEAALAYVFVGHEVRQADDALSRQRQLAQRLATGSRDRRLNEQPIPVGVAQRPVIEGFGLGEAEQ
ncbi:hypothetical protein AO263_00510 [Pseudomonas sp. NZIPFR-PS5]|nr:hypothetical protein AO263_00510 [Pseudomonas sp. NZIPFR-PS5]